jgi:hypothetical protein
MQELLLGSFGAQLVAFVARYPWQVFAGVLVATLIVIDLLRRNRSSASGDIDLGFLGDGDGGGD